MTSTDLEIPARLARRPRNHAGYVVPWFVGWVDGEPDFRVMDLDHLFLAVRLRLCWLCGEALLANPNKRRREGRMPEGAVDPAGIMLKRNPGVALLWSTRKYQLFRDGQGGVLFDIGEPTDVRWYVEGRPARRGEVLESIESGLPSLRQLAEEEGAKATAELDRRVIRALALVPA